ncbi:regulator of Ty1 Transposition [Basidiobolus ranarum]|uniref:Regulator of Ty1 Transposition n=1 Tax=Basidiobolus ranarum TaxID=34480 RepID=A0ABR2X5C5_9FUNG
MRKKIKSASKKVFGDKNIYISPWLETKEYEEIKEILVEHEAFIVKDKKDPENLYIITRDISDGFDIEQCTIVTPNWVYQTIHTGYLQSEVAYSPDPFHVFSGTVISSIHLSEFDQDSLFAGVEALGGQWTEDYTADVTHLVAAYPDGEMYEKAISSNTCQVVIPHWIDDSLKLRRILPEKVYSYPEPSIYRLFIDQGETSVFLPASQTDRIPVFYPEDQTVPVPNSKFLQGYTFLLSDDLTHIPEIIQVLHERLEQAGAKVAKTYSKNVNCIVCKYRLGDIYIRASLDQQIIGNLTWLYYILNVGKISNPLRFLLHYPLPKGGIPQFQTYTITLTNYIGNAREYLKRLIVGMGATYTGHMGSTHSHLICGSLSGEKCRKAQEWNVNMVNHLWLEDCFRSWTLHSITKHQYVHFPNGINLTDVIGQCTQLSNKITDWYRKVELGPDTGSHSKSHEIPRENPEKLETDITQAHSSNSNLDFETNHFVKTSFADKSNRATIVKKTKQIQLGQKSNHVNSKSLLDKEKMVKKQDNIAEPLIIDKLANDVKLIDDQGQSDDKASARAPKKRKKIADPKQSSAESTISKTSSRSIRILSTGVKLTEKEIKGIKALGAKIATSPKDCTHLIANQATRTEKFLSAISVAEYILTRDWVNQSLKAHTFLDEEGFQLEDEASEKNYQFSLKESLIRAKSKKLLDKMTVYITPSTQPKSSTMKSLIECAGGKLVTTYPRKRQRSNTSASPSTSSNSSDLVVVSCDEDCLLWESIPENIPLFTSEFILTGLLKQELNWGPEFSLRE